MTYLTTTVLSYYLNHHNWKYQIPQIPSFKSPIVIQYPWMPLSIRSHIWPYPALPTPCTIAQSLTQAQPAMPVTHSVSHIIRIVIYAARIMSTIMYSLTPALCDCWNYCMSFIQAWQASPNLFPYYTVPKLACAHLSWPKFPEQARASWRILDKLL
jgi:hypothetical protein